MSMSGNILLIKKKEVLCFKINDTAINKHIKSRKCDGKIIANEKHESN